MLTREALAARLPDVPTHREWLRLCREVARREGVKPATVSAAAIRLSAQVVTRPEPQTYRVTAPGPAVGQSRPRVWAGGRVGQSAPSAWARERWRRLALAIAPAPAGRACGVEVTIHARRHGKPDVDNVGKLVMDALADAGVIRDDCDVDALRVQRFVGLPERVEVRVMGDW